MTMPTPSYASVDGQSYDVLSSEIIAAGGAHLRDPVTGRKRTTMTLVYAPGQLDATTAQDLIDVWETAKGSAGTFTMTDYLTGGSASWRFVDDDLDLDVQSIVSYGCSVAVVKEGI